MKNYVFISLLLIFCLSLGAVCASDAVSEDVLSEDNFKIVEGAILDEDSQNPMENEDLSEKSILEETQDNILSENEENSFSQLQMDIDNSTDILEITHDYKFNNDTDNLSMISIEKDNFVINGNSHVIDANNLSAIFSISGTNITLNNLILKNANANSGSALYISEGSTVTTNNVTFTNSIANYGIILTVRSIYNSNDDKFLDCKSNLGVIYGVGSNLIFNNSLSRSSEELKWGFIKSSGLSYIGVFNSIFANTTSQYSTAIMGTGNLEIINCTFINLYANLTAGAIGLKDIQEVYIENCTFNNVHSQKNGGAIFIDAYSSEKMPEVEIVDSNFIDCSSQFGGAILQLEGCLDVDNCNFTNNLAFFDGGAIYVSWTNLTVENSIFNNNSVLYDGERGSFGGAIFADASSLSVEDSELIANSAYNGGALYLYDTDYDIRDNLFENNLNFNGTYDDIFTAFDAEMQNTENNTYSGDDSLSLNNEFYELITVTPAIKLPILNNSIDVDSIPSKFDLRDWGWVTPVRDQGSSGVCWAFGSAGTMESAILKFLGVEMGVSENNIADVSFKYSRYGSSNVHEGGGFTTGANYALSWLGVFSSEYDVYDELGKISPIIAVNSTVHFQDIICVRPCENGSDIEHVKKAVLKYGGLYVKYFAAQESPYFNEETNAQYCDNESASTNHGVVLVGWDDSYPKENFLITPPGDGAWIFKNSWGKFAGDEGYFHISYYDTTFLKSDNSYGFLFINDVEYNKNYQYDLQGSFFIYEESNEYRNNFVAIEDDLIAGVETYFNDTGVDYTVEIYVNDKLIHVQNGTSPFAGYHTIKLDSYIPIKKYNAFTVKIKSNNVPVLGYSRQHYIPNSSEIFTYGAWTDAAQLGLVCNIKAYTVADDTKIINNKNIAVDYDGGKYFSVKVVTDDGHAVGIGEKVTFTINKKTTTVTTNKNGIAKIKITDVPKKYTITTKYKGKTYKNTVTVKQVLKTAKVTVKKTAKKFTLKATLKINGKLVKGKTITFNFKGKNYKVKTNSKGIAQKTLNKNVIKKLQKGKTYTVKVTYLKDTIKTSVKVK